MLMAGRRGDGAYWYEADGGNFITSTYYMKTVPAWLEAWNRRRVPDSYAASPWSRLLADEALYRRYAGEDAVEGEWDRKDTVFPHAVRGRPPARDYYDDLRRTPFADEMTLSVALEAMKAYDLGRDDATDLLAVSFSATDVIGHTYGADSQEVMDQLLRLDVTLGRLLEEVDRQAGPGRTLVVLSADHGSLPLVEVLHSRGIGARRVLPAVLESAVRNALAERFAGAEDLIADADPPNFYLDLEAIRRRGLSRPAVEETVEKALLSTGLVESVYTHARLMGDPPSEDPYFQLFGNAFFPPRSPHIMVRIGEYIYLSDRPGGTGHGTAYERDRQVPIIFMGPTVAAGTYAKPCGPEDIAPTLAKILGLDYPLQDGARAHRDGPPMITALLRRTCATGCAELGAPPHVVASILGHKTMPGAGRATAVYDRSKRVREVAPWLNAWAAYIDKIAIGQESKTDIVRLVRA